MTIWIWATLVCLAAVAALLLPALRRRRDLSARAEYDINVYKDQLVELEREAVDGRIAVDEMTAARLEIERRLLAAGKEAETASAPRRMGGIGVLAGAAVAASLAAFAVYAELGRPGVPDFPLSARAEQPPSPQQDAAPADQRSLADLIKALESRLQANPDDAQGWEVLGRTYATLGKAREAAAAYQRAVELSNRDPNLLADWAEARLMSRDGEFTIEIYNDFVESRERAPTLPKAWFYIGLDKAMGGDFRGAAQVWTDLLAFTPPEAGIHEAVREQIARAAEQGGFAPGDITPTETAQKLAEGIAAVPPKTEMQTQAAPAVPGPTREQMEAAGEMSDAERQAFIRSMVDRLASRLEDNPNDRAGWARLIQAYKVLGETEKAAEAQARLDALADN